MDDFLCVLDEEESLRERRGGGASNTGNDSDIEEIMNDEDSDESDAQNDKPSTSNAEDVDSTNVPAKNAKKIRKYQIFLQVHVLNCTFKTQMF